MLTGTGSVSCTRRARVAKARALGTGWVTGCVLTARHVIAPAAARPGGRVLVRPVRVLGWLPARVEWENADADAALVVIEEEGWRAPGGESVLRWGSWPAVIRCRARRWGSRGRRCGRTGCGIPRTLVRPGVSGGLYVCELLIRLPDSSA